MNLEKVWIIKQLDLPDLVLRKIYWNYVLHDFLNYISQMIQLEAIEYEHWLDWIVYGYEDVTGSEYF